MANSTVRAPRYKMNLEYLVMPNIFEALQKMMGMSKGHNRTFTSRKTGTT